MSLQGSGGYQSPWSSQGGHSELDGTLELEPLGELTEVGFEPQTRARSNTWPLPRPDNYVEAADDTGSKKNSNQNLSGAPPLPTTTKKNSSRRNAWGNLSYADLITQAITSAQDNRLTLSQIYEWMVQNVPYFKDKGDSNSSAGWKTEVDKEAWMAEVSKDAEKRYQDRKVRRERAETFNTQAIKAFRRGEYDKALSCYNKAIEQIRDNPMFYCDRALTNIKLGKFEKVAGDCDLALRLNEKSYKARLYLAKAHKELEELDKLEESRKEIDEMFPQHKELTQFFLDKKVGYEIEDEDE